MFAAPAPIKGPSGKAVLDYYESTVSRSLGTDLDDYYGERGDKVPEAFIAGRDPDGVQETAVRLGVKPGDRLSTDDVVGWLGEGRTPAGEQMGRAFSGRSVHGFDLPYASPKEVSLLWALGDERVSAAAEQAHMAGLHAAVDHLASHTAVTQVRTSDQATGPQSRPDIEELQALSGAIYHHRTNRAGDMHLHSHVLVHNRQLDASGEWRSLDGSTLLRDGHWIAAGAVGQATMRADLTRSIGAEWGQVDPDTGLAPLLGIDRAAVEKWSTRHTDMDQWVEEHCEHGDSAAARELARRETRQAKDLSMTTAELREAWRGDNRASSVNIAEVVGRHRGDEPPALPTPEQVEELATRSTSAPTRAEMVKAAASLMPSTVDPASVGGLIEQLVEQTRTRPMFDTEVDPDLDRAAFGRISHRRESETTYTSERVIREEAELVTLGAEHVGLGLAPEAVDVGERRDRQGGIAKNGHALTDIQADAMRGLVGHQGRTSVLIGPAGTAKTTSLNRAREAWENDGRTVYGLAKGGAAADKMAAESVAHTADTIDLARLGIDLETGKTPWKPGSVIVVDEAGMASTRDLHMLTAAAKAAACKLVLVGDPEQLDAPGGRGGALRLLAEDLPPGAVQHLSEVFRQRDPEEAKATLAVRDGIPSSADWYAEHERLHIGSEAAMLEDAYSAWSTDVRAGRDSIIHAPRRDIASALNRRAQHDMIAAGRVNAEAGHLPLAGTERCHIGDTILTRKNDYRAKDTRGQVVRNGHRWTVRSLRDERGRVVLERADEPGVTATVTPDYLAEHGNLGYATTTHAKQGADANHNHHVQDTGTSTRNMLYVGVSRGKETNHTYLIERERGSHDHDHGGKPSALEYRRGTTQEARDAFVDILGRDDRDRPVHLRIRDKSRAYRARLADAGREMPQPRTKAAQVDKQRSGRGRELWERFEAAQQARRHDKGHGLGR